MTVGRLQIRRVNAFINLWVQDAITLALRCVAYVMRGRLVIAIRSTLLRLELAIGGWPARKMRAWSPSKALRASRADACQADALLVDLLSRSLSLVLVARLRVPVDVQRLCAR